MSTIIAAMERLAPRHLRRDLTRTLSPTQSEALGVVHKHLLPEAQDLTARFKLPYFAHVMESSEAGDWEHVVLPDMLVVKYRATLDKAGFQNAPDTRQFAVADGLKEALFSGSNFNKRWT